MRIVLAGDRSGALLCRRIQLSKLPEGGQAFTIEEASDEPPYAASVLAVARGPRRTPLIYGGPWPHHADDPELKRHGFGPCSTKEREAIETELARGAD